MGGHAAGEVASRTAVEAAARYIQERRSVVERFQEGDAEPSELTRTVKDAVLEACAAIHKLATSKPGHAGMGSTLTLLLVAGAKAVMAHVGDTRLYLCRNGKIHQLSTDHTMAAELARSGAIRPDEVRDHQLAHVLTRVVGTQASVQVDVLLMDVLPGDRFLLCSDGLSDKVESLEWLAREIAGDDLESVAEELIRASNEAGGQDNITAVIVRADVEDAERPMAIVFGENIEVKLSALRSVFLFEGLTLAQLTRILNACHVEEYEAGEGAIHAGESCERLMTVVNGSFRLEQNGREILRLRPGDHVGETTLLNARPCRATLRAAQVSRLLVLESEVFLEIIKGRPWLGVSLLERLARRLSVDLDRERAADPAKGGESGIGSPDRCAQF
jgi:serine/threonine protein phosphatase PrpC